MAKNVVSKNWSGWIRASDGYLRSDDPYGLYGQGTPALPTSYVTRTYSLPTGGTTWTATSSGSTVGSGGLGETGCGHLHAFANCSGGDVIIMSAGVTYTPFQLRNLAAESFVYVISSALASLPAAGTRVTSSDASNMPKIEGTNALGAIYTATSAHHYRFVGIEITNKATDQVYSTVTIGNGETTDATAPHHILFDRCYVHGRTHATIAGRRGFYVTGSNIGVFDSYVSNYYENGADSQAILLAYGAGPFCIRNNYLEAASENVMFGGTTTIPISGSIASDVEIVHNTFNKPTAWVAAGVTDVKNLFESKGGRRVLIEGNIFQNCWADAQNGFGMVLTHRDQAGNTPWMNNTDFTIRKNKWIATGAGVVIAGRDSNFPTTSPVATRILFENNQILGDGNSTGGSASAGYGFQIGYGVAYLTIRHNTIIAYKYPSYTLFNAEGYKQTNFVCQNNVWNGDGAAISQYDIVGDSFLGFNSVATNYYTTPTFSYNTVTFASSANYNNFSNNFFPANVAAVGFTNFAGGIFSLTGGSTYHNAGSDGTDIGCDFTALNAAIA